MSQSDLYRRSSSGSSNVYNGVTANMRVPIGSPSLFCIGFTDPFLHLTLARVILGQTLGNCAISAAKLCER